MESLSYIKGHKLLVTCVILDSKYGGWRGLLDAKVSTKSSIWWWNLCAICGGKYNSNWFSSNSKWDIGIGDKILFWHDT